MATVTSPVSSALAVPVLAGRRWASLRRASTVLQQVSGECRPHDVRHGLTDPPCRVDGEDAPAIRQARCAIHGQPSPAWPWPVSRRMRPPQCQSCRRPFVSQQGLYAIHPALLDACFQSVWRASPIASRWWRPIGAAVGGAPSPCLCSVRTTAVRAGDQVELVGVRRIDVLDARHGVAGPCADTTEESVRCRERDKHNQVLNERLLTIRWLVTAKRWTLWRTGKWLLISDCALPAM